MRKFEKPGQKFLYQGSANAGGSSVRRSVSNLSEALDPAHRFLAAVPTSVSVTPPVVPDMVDIETRIIGLAANYNK